MANQVLANSPAGGPVQGEGGLFALKASDSSAAGYGVVGITAAVDVLGDMRGTSPLDSTRPLAGVYGISDLPPGPDTAGVLGENFQSGPGVRGKSNSGDGLQGIASQTGRSGVTGINSGGGNGVFGQSGSGRGVVGTSNTGVGVFGESAGNDGVQGRIADSGHSGVAGFNDGDGNGVFGRSFGKGFGVFGESAGNDGVQGISNAAGKSGVAGIHTGGGNGIFGQGSPAGHFVGDVNIEGGNLIMMNGADIRLADFSEDFDVAAQEQLDPGTVVVLDNNGSLRKSQTAYDRKVAGVISGAGDFRPAITLDRQTAAGNRIPIALMGKVYCKVDAQYAALDVGDLLTTSPTPGHAMRAEDPLRAFGSVIKKALGRLSEGKGLIPILVALQ